MGMSVEDKVGNISLWRIKWEISVGSEDKEKDVRGELWGGCLWKIKWGKSVEY